MVNAKSGGVGLSLNTKPGVTGRLQPYAGVRAAKTVPFPEPGTEKLDHPDATEARVIAGGVAGAAAPAAGVTSLQRMVIEACVESMTGFVVSTAAVPRIGPDAFAEGMRSRTEMFRTRMIHF